MEDNFNPKFERMLEKFLKESGYIQEEQDKRRKKKERRYKNNGKDKKRFD